MRTYPVTFLHDVTRTTVEPDWHELTYASRGHLEVIAGDTRRLVPADRAVWVPAGVRHTNVMRAPISMRSIYVAASATRRVPREVRTIVVTPLLRELVQHVTRIGALDRADPVQARLVGVLIDQIAAAEAVALDLPSPRDPRARKFAELVTAKPGGDKSIAALARKAGASLRTIERAFLVETGLTVGEWRRRVRLFHALHLLESGASVTDVAFEVGYATTSAFGQAFRRQFGRVPTAFTRVNRSK